jgi:hypothetical protein
MPTYEGMRLVVLALVLFTTTAHADGPCCPFGVRHDTMFEKFDKATSVARVEIKSVAPLAFETIATFKGPAPAQLVPRGLAACEPQFAAGDKAIVFVDGDGKFVGGFAFHGYIAQPDSELLTRLDAWSKAKTVDTRAVEITETITGGGAFAEAAVRFLSDAPDVLNAITLAQRDRIVGTIDHADDGSMLPLVMWRLGVPDLAKRIPKRMTFRKRALQLAAHDFSSVTDPRVLANELANVRIGSSARGAAAYERCERLLGKRPHTFWMHLEYVHSMDSPAWRRITRLCRRG